jgi:hypothetical protein
MERYWQGALDKVRREGRCRVCGSTGSVQAAHTVGRVHDRKVELEDGSTAIYVDPNDIVPLCVDHHADYDQNRLSLIEHLTRAEQASAVRHLGIARALDRLSGRSAAITPIA